MSAAAAAKFLRRHHRLHLSSSALLRNRSPLSSHSSNLFGAHLVPRNSSSLNSHHLFTNGFARSFFWGASNGGGGGGGGDGSSEKISKIGSDLISVDDGSGAGPEVSTLGFSPEIASELSSGVEGSAVGSEDGLGIVEAAVGESAWWDPTSTVSLVLDGFHDLTGLPWWLIICTSILALRVALLPVLIVQLKKMGKITVLLPKLPPPLPPLFSGKSFREQYSLFQKKRQELGCPSYLWSFAFFTVQFPCFLLWMTSIRRMCLDLHPGFDSGGTLWFQNLTDFPHGMLGSTFPILIAGLHYINVQISFQTVKVDEMRGILGLLAKYYKLYLDILALPLLFIGFHIPQGSLVYWVTNSSLTLIQQLSLRSPYIRKKLGLPDEKILRKKNISKPNVIVDQDDRLLQIDVSTEALSPEQLLDLALEHIAAGHNNKAIPLLRLAIERDPEMAKALIAMGQTLYSKELFVEAAEYFERAIAKMQHDKDNCLLVLACFGAAVSYMSQGRKSEAIQHLKGIAELKVPDSPMDKACYYRGLAVLGSLLFVEGEKSEAAKYLRIAATYDPAVSAYLKECEEGE